MAHPNVTVMEVQNVDEDQINKKKGKKIRCKKCEKIFEKNGKQSLHMRKTQNIKALQYTPATSVSSVGG